MLTKILQNFKKRYRYQPKILTKITFYHQKSAKSPQMATTEIKDET